MNLICQKAIPDQTGTPMIDVLIEPWEFAFMQRALLAASFAALVCSVVGVFVVLRGMAFMGDAVAHSSLAGM